MQVHLLRLESLLQQVRSLDSRAFADRYPGAFMVALGYLVEEDPGEASGDQLVIEPTKTRPKEASLAHRLDHTVSVKLGSVLRQDTGKRHPLAGYVFQLSPSATRQHVLMGRAPHSDILVPDRSVSEEHCRIEIAPQGVIIIDLMSTNGTVINKIRLGRGGQGTLADEDLICLGRYSFQLLSSESLYEALSAFLPD